MKQSSYRWELGACSDIGLVRQENQDRISSIRIGAIRVYLVVDGMGGHKAGALAAELTIAALEDNLKELLAPGRDITAAIQKAFAAANQLVYNEAHSENADVSGMGATVVMLLTEGQQAYIAHVGDSRAYLFRKRRLNKLTTDHSPIQRMLSAGILTPRQARNHPQASIVDRAIGDKPQVEVDIAEPFTLENGDGVLLCSDGLCGYVDDDGMETAINNSGNPQEAADALLKAALDAGGEDNISVQFIRLSHAEGLPVTRGARQWLGGLLKMENWLSIFAVLIMALSLVGLFFLHPETADVDQPLPLEETRKPVESKPETEAIMEKPPDITQLELAKLHQELESSRKAFDKLEREHALLWREYRALHKKTATSKKKAAKTKPAADKPKQPPAGKINP